MTKFDFFTTKYCCDPYFLHERAIKGNLTTLHIDTCKDAWECLSIRIIPGKKICKKCHVKIIDDINERKDFLASEIVSSSDSEIPVENRPDSQYDTPQEICKERLDACFKALKVSPIKLSKNEYRDNVTVKIG